MCSSGRPVLLLRSPKHYEAIMVQGVPKLGGCHLGSIPNPHQHKLYRKDYSSFQACLRRLVAVESLARQPNAALCQVWTTVHYRWTTVALKMSAQPGG
jgi:hypothetical protein